MTRRTLLLSSSAGLLWAADPWSKDPGQWSEKDVEKLLSKSPWAREIPVEMRTGGPGQGGGMGGERRGGGRGMGGGGGMGAGGGPMGGPGGAGAGVRQDNGPGDNVGGMDTGYRPQVSATVRWESAQPIRDARKQTGDPGEFYVLSLSGLPMFGGRRGQPEGPPDEDRLKMMEGRMKSATSLDRKGKDPIAPEKIAFKEGVVLFSFPHTSQPIQPEDKEVIFVTRMGPMELKAKFPLKDMLYHGKLAL